MNRIILVFAIILMGFYAKSYSQESSMEIYTIDGEFIENGASLAVTAKATTKFLYTDLLLIKNVSLETIRLKVRKIEKTMVGGSINIFTALAQDMDVNENITNVAWELEPGAILPDEAFFKGGYSSIYQGSPIIGTSSILYSFLSVDANDVVLDSVYVYYSYSNTSISPLDEDENYIYNQEILVNTDTQEVSEFSILLHNHTSETVGYRVSKTILESEEGHDIYFKFGGVEYSVDENTSNANGVNIGTDETLSGENGFVAMFNANGVGGTQLLSKVKYKFFNKVAGNDADYVTLIYNPSGVGFSELNGYEISEPYPNPADDYVYIDHDLQGFDNVEIKVYNTAGQLILIHPVQKNSRQSVLYISDFQSGVYFVSIEIDEKPLGIEKLVIR